MGITSISPSSLQSLPSPPSSPDCTWAAAPYTRLAYEIRGVVSSSLLYRDSGIRGGDKLTAETTHQSFGQVMVIGSLLPS
jgi:hypothetical protein